MICLIDAYYELQMLLAKDHRCLKTDDWQLCLEEIDIFFRIQQWNVETADNRIAYVQT